MNDKQLAANLFNQLEKTQWTHKPDLEYPKQFPVLTREEFRKIKQPKGAYSTRTSGSTGEQVTIERTVEDLLWLKATNLRLYVWRKWDFKNNMAMIKIGVEDKDYPEWGVPREIASVQGKIFMSTYKPISELQSWLEEKNPHYIDCRKSVFDQIDTSKISNFIAYGGTGELGGDIYSSEEFGTIAIKCPDNPKVYHVMENLIVEVDEDGQGLITSLTHPNLKRYKIGDVFEIGECFCGRTLQTITMMYGRIRNLFVLPNGDKKFLLFGVQSFYDSFGIKRHQTVQTDINNLEISVIADKMSDEKEKEFIDHVKKFINSPINISIKYVDSFPPGKFEEFKSLVI